MPVGFLTQLLHTDLCEQQSRFTNLAAFVGKSSAAMSCSYHTAVHPVLQF